MYDQRREGEEPDQDRVPVEDAGGARERAEVRPQRLEEVAALVQRDAAHDVAQSGAVEDRQQGAPDKEHRVPKGGPQGALQVRAKLYGEAPDHQQPEHDDQRQIEPRETGGVQQGEREEQGAARRDQPDLVSVPHGADGADDHAPLPIVSGGEQVYGTRTKVKTVQQDVHRHHQCHADKPDRLHRSSSSSSDSLGIPTSRSRPPGRGPPRAPSALCRGGP